HFTLSLSSTPPEHQSQDRIGRLTVTKKATGTAMATTSHPHTPHTKPKRRRDAAMENFGLGSDDEDFCTPPGVTRKVRPTTPLAPRSPNAATAPVYVGTT
ncbi:unnamed protein product, partial [Pylaiella littoralis]